MIYHELGRMTGNLLLLCALFITAVGANKLLLPGVTPSAWDDGETIVLKANKITSTDSPVVYDYYDMPFCRRKKRAKARAGNLGESLSGDATTASPYEVSALLQQVSLLLLFSALAPLTMESFLTFSNFSLSPI